MHARLGHALLCDLLLPQVGTTSFSAKVNHPRTGQAPLLEVRKNSSGRRHAIVHSMQSRQKKEKTQEECLDRFWRTAIARQAALIAFLGSIGELFRQIGNAAPPLFLRRGSLPKGTCLRVAPASTVWTESEAPDNALTFDRTRLTRRLFD